MTTLAQYLNVASSEYTTECETEATALVDRHIGTATVPPDIRDRAVLEVAADLFYRRETRNGVVAFGGQDGGASVAPVRVSRDPMKAATDLLRPYLGPGIA
ncbi:hypothetical protein CGZ94_04920 [Enemella evansiae]|uniref:Phage gp6-like head-tail connector protein n=1 Tax=Enemella evansiae TaxID=2016499 RepID=A0A255GKE1_9ACTN|nr:hypothetical protein [Enemella evansiae]OYO16285.1 hypothetical protein CGZ94_04920 [Enemella evansiae]